MAKYYKGEDIFDEVNRFSGYIDGDMILRINTAIKRLPCEDVEPTTHSHWHVGGIIDGVEFVYCKKCGFQLKNASDKSIFNYCPHCGAKMDETEVGIK